MPLGNEFSGRQGAFRLGIGLAPIDGDANHDPVAGIARAYDATNLDSTPIDPHVG
jgi:hypothetical protein